MSVTDVQRFTPDPQNANKGTARGRLLLRNSLENYGAGRSILADKNDLIIAGNKTYEEADALGLPTRVIETDGSELVVVKRTDLDLETDNAARELAWADNRIAEIDLEWDVEELMRDQQRGINLAAIGFPDDEINALIAAAHEGEPVVSDTNLTIGDSQWLVIVSCDNEREQEKIYAELSGRGLSVRVVVG